MTATELWNLSLPSDCACCTGVWHSRVVSLSVMKHHPVNAIISDDIFCNYIQQYILTNYIFDVKYIAWCKFTDISYIYCALNIYLIGINLLVSMTLTIELFWLLNVICNFHIPLCVTESDASYMIFTVVIIARVAIVTVIQQLPVLEPTINESTKIELSNKSVPQLHDLTLTFSHYVVVGRVCLSQEVLWSSSNNCILVNQQIKS